MRALLVVCLLCLAGPVLAETVYVTDVLRVGLRSAPGSGEAPLTVVTSGTALTVLERQGGQAQVRTADGIEGWLSESYLTAEVPARLRLERMEQERTKLRAELERLRSSDAAAQTAQLAAQVAAMEQETARLQAENTRLEAENSAFAARLQVREDRSAWLYAAAGFAVVVLLLFGLGVYLGMHRERRRVTQRLGGLEL